MGEAGGKVALYFSRLGPYSRHVLEAYLNGLEPGVVPESLKGPRSLMRPAQISANQDELKAFREPWNMQSCLTSVRRSGVYEATGCIWWLSDSAETTPGERGGYLAAVGAEPTWGQFLAAQYF